MEEKTKERIRKLKKEAWDRRRKKIKIPLFFLVILFLFFGVYQIKRVIVNYLWNLEIFALEEIKVYPENLYPLITETLGLEKGKNLLFLDIEEINRKISQLRFVERCSIKKLFPSTIEIEITTRKPWVMIEDGKSSVFIDGFGVVVSPPENIESYWKVKGIGIGKISIVESDREKIAVLKEIEKWYNFFNIANFYKINRIDISNLEKIILINEGKKIYIVSENLKEKFEDLERVLADCAEKNTQWEYIELRFKSPYVKKIIK